MKFIISFFLLLSSIAFAQTAKEIADSNINMLRSGTLLVRLRTQENKINALEKQGQAIQANEIKKKQAEENKIIAEAFKKHFNFCNIYFFYSTYSVQIRELNTNGFLMDFDLKNDSTIKIDNFLVGEFDNITTTQLDAFVIEDKEFKKLKKPFPSYIKLNKFLVIEKSKEEIVSQLNNTLTEYWIGSNK